MLYLLLYLHRSQKNAEHEADGPPNFLADKMVVTHIVLYKLHQAPKFISWPPLSQGLKHPQG